MRIESLKLGGHDIAVVYEPIVRDEDTGAEIFGKCDPFLNKISIALTIKGKTLAEDVLLHSLCHEIVHYILMLMNEHELNGNEQFVDQVGGFAHQAIKSYVAKKLPKPSGRRKGPA
jgi:hypothetical protein